MSFPSSPTVGQQATVGGRQFVWQGSAWDLVATVTGHAAQHAINGSDPLTITAAQVSNFSSAVEAASPAPIHPFLLMGG
jgi:hypothetical protein